jgi:hypothetical protein
MLAQVLGTSKALFQDSFWVDWRRLLSDRSWPKRACQLQSRFLNSHTASLFNNRIVAGASRDPNCKFSGDFLRNRHLNISTFSFPEIVCAA